MMQLELFQTSPDLVQMIFNFSMSDTSSDTTDIIKNVTEQLKRLSHSGFQERFQHLAVGGRSLCLPQGTILKGMELKLLYWFVFLRHKVTLETF